MKRLMFLALPLLLAGSAAAQAKTDDSKLKWIAGPPGLPSGGTFAVVSGDPGKKGMFTIRAKFPAGYAVPAHWHPTDEHVTVVSGTLGYGMSGKLDHGHAKWLAAGKDVTMQAKHDHWVFADKPAEIEVGGMGPFAITYVNPKDDPRKR